MVKDFELEPFYLRLKIDLKDITSQMGNNEKETSSVHKLFKEEFFSEFSFIL